MSRTRILPILAALLVATPLATATWAAHSNYEPDTAQDAQDGFMFTDPDTSPTGQKVYFNAVQNTYQMGANPNSGHAGSRILAPISAFGAFLGVWKDCNGDGFVGAVDSVLIEYRSELLLETGVCPDGSEHNKNGWVYEFLWIGPDDISFSADSNAGRTARQINDTAAKVWGDVGLAVPRDDGASAGNTCAITPLPRGTTSSTGGLIAYLECGNGPAVTGTANTVEELTTLPVGFDDAETPQRSDSLLNQRLPVSTFGDPYAPEGRRHGVLEGNSATSGDQSMFRAWDCSSDPIAVALPTGQVKVRDETGQLPRDVADPTDPEADPLVTGVVDEDGNVLTIGDEEGDLVLAPAPSPAVGGGASAYEGVNQTTSACDGGFGTPGFDGLPENDGGGTAQTPAKRSHDFVFSFNSIYSFGLTYVGQDEVVGPDTPEDLGMGYFRGAVGSGTGWTGLPNLVNGAQLGGAAYYTFYAKVGDATLATGAQLPGQLGVYQSEYCEGATTGVHRGVDCDASHWWDAVDHPGTPAMSTQGARTSETCTGPQNQRLDGCRDLGARAGETYQLRDIDCYDGQVARGAPVYAAPLAYVPETTATNANAFCSAPPVA